MLPTDQRWIDLTEEQLDLLYEHYIRLNPPKDNNKLNDDDYDEAHDKVDADTGAVVSGDEHYVDPDFDEEWNRTDEEGDVSNSNIIGENPPSEDFEIVGEDVLTDTGFNRNFDPNDFEEVE